MIRHFKSLSVTVLLSCSCLALLHGGPSRMIKICRFFLRTDSYHNPPGLIPFLMSGGRFFKHTGYLLLIIILYRLNQGGNTMIFPVGSWSGWYFSEEINHARSLGYTCSFVEGYKFEKSNNLFKEYVQTMYKL
jgi:hypothetical protein